MPIPPKVPDIPEDIEAITEVRGKVILIINLKQWLKVHPTIDK